MPRRVTVPDGHIALVLPNQLGDELMSLLRYIRLMNGPAATRVARANALGESAALRPADPELNQQRNIAGDVLLAILEAKEV